MFLLSMLLGCEGPSVDIYCEDTGWWDTATDGPRPPDEDPDGDGNGDDPDEDDVVYEGPYVEIPSDAPLTCDVGEPSMCLDPFADQAWVSIYAETRYACDGGASYGASLGAFQASRLGSEVALVPGIALGDDVVVSAADYAEWADAVPQTSTLDLVVGTDGIVPSDLDLAALLHTLGDADTVHTIDGVSTVVDGDCLRIDIQGHICDQCGGTCSFTTSIWVSSLDVTSGYGVITGPR